MIVIGLFRRENDSNRQINNTLRFLGKDVRNDIKKKDKINCTNLSGCCGIHPAQKEAAVRNVDKQEKVNQFRLGTRGREVQGSSPF
jgi:hypothetical protein